MVEQGNFIGFDKVPRLETSLVWKEGHVGD